jgi:hypothetical protein
VALIWNKPFYSFTPKCVENPRCKTTLYPSLSAFFTKVYTKLGNNLYTDEQIIDNIIGFLPFPELAIYKRLA